MRLFISLISVFLINTAAGASGTSSTTTTTPVSPFPPTMNMRKFCETIRNPNMCLMKNGCEWKAATFECGQLNCEKIFGWQNCAKSAGCIFTPDDMKCNDQAEAGAFAGLQFGPSPMGGQSPGVTGFSPQAFAQPTMFNMPQYTNPMNGDTLDGYYGGYEPPQASMQFAEYEGPFQAFEMEDLFKNPAMYSSMLTFFNQYMDQKFTVCSTLSDQAQCDIEQACSWSAGSCTRNTFGVASPFYPPYLSEPHPESQTTDDKQPVVFYVGLGFAGVVLGFLSAVGLQSLCCNKQQEAVGLDQYLRQNV